MASVNSKRLMISVDFMGPDEVKIDKPGLSEGRKQRQWNGYLSGEAMRNWKHQSIP